MLDIVDRKKDRVSWADRLMAITAIITLLITITIQSYSMLRFDSLIESNNRANLYQIMDNWLAPNESMIMDLKNYANSDAEVIKTVANTELKFKLYKLLSRYEMFLHLVSLSKIDENKVLIAYQSQVDEYLEYIKEINNKIPDEMSNILTVDINKRLNSLIDKYGCRVKKFMVPIQKTQQ